MLFRLAWRNLWRNRLRSGIVIAAMVFGISAVVFMAGLMQAMIDNMVENAIQTQLGHAQIHQHDFTLQKALDKVIPDSEIWLERLARHPAVAAFSPRMVHEGMVNSATANRGVVINGIEFEREKQVTNVLSRLVTGTLPGTQRNRILVSVLLAEKLNLRTGSKLVLTFTDRDGEITGAAFRIAGLFQTPSSVFDETQVFIRQQDLRQYTRQQGIHEIALRVHNSKELSGLLADLKMQTGKDTLIRDWGEIQPLLSMSVNSIATTNALLLGIVMLSLGFGITNVMLMVVFERSREFAVMQAMGMRQLKTVNLVLIESLLLGLTGGIGGMLLGWLFLLLAGHWGISLAAFSAGVASYGVSNVLYPQAGSALFAVLFALVVFTSLLAGLYPSRHLMKQDLAQALAKR